MAELPVVKKCCFCVPLRYGLLTWGYLKLASALIALAFLIFFVIVLSQYVNGESFLMTLISLVAVILATEIVLHIVVIVGAHKKNVKLLKIYYYYAVFMWVVTIVWTITVAVFLIPELNNFDSNRVLQSIFYLLLGLSIVFSIVVQTFLVLSLRSEIIKLRSNCPYRFVKDGNEPEGTISSVKCEENMSMENGTVPIL